ncbi:hypothetical protein [Streptomyces sp. NPDC002690]
MTVVNKAGYKREFDFAGIPGTEPIQRSLATCFAAKSSSWKSHRSAVGYWRKAKMFATFIAELEDPPADLDELTAAMLKRWRTRHIGSNSGKGTLNMVRVLLKQDPRLATGPAAEELARRIPKVTPSKQSYEEDEREQVVLAAQRQFRTALLRIRENTLLLESWRAGTLAEGSREWRIGKVLDHLAQTADVPRTLLPSGQTNVTNARLLGGRASEHTWRRLFLDRRELTALALLMTDKFGWNLSVYDRMPTPTSTPSVGEKTSVTYQLQIEKRRAGVGRWFSTENITDSGADSSGRLITQALEATAHGRALAARLVPGTDWLMAARTHRPGQDHQYMDRPRPVGPIVFGVADDEAGFWATSHGLGGSPFQRVRRTTVAREGRPLQHAQSTHESVYVIPDKRVQRTSRGAFEDGALEALEQAKSIVFGGHLTDEPDADHQETVVADCEDETTSPWPAPEGGCGADFLLCLACANAHVHPGHHPRLAYLHQQLEGLRSALPDRGWQERWNDHHLRLEDLREKVTPVVWNASLARVGESDRAMVHLLLKGELTP